MLEANGRLDGSEKFPKSKRYGFFPSVSAAWRISAEPFMEPFSGVLSNLKLRTSWGRAGTDNIGQFQYMSAYGTGGDAVFGGQNPEIARDILKPVSRTPISLGKLLKCSISV